MTKRNREARQLRQEIKERNDEMKEMKRRRKEAEKEERNKRKSDKEEEKKRVKDGQVRRLILDEFELVMEGVMIKEEAKATQYATVDGRVITRCVLKGELRVFMEVVPREVWQHVCDHTNMELDRRVRSGEVSKDYAARYAERVTVDGLLTIFGVRMRIGLRDENTEVTKRMRLVLSSLSCDWVEFVGLLRSNWKRCITPCEIYCIDEAIFAFKPRGKQKTTCPKRYIPRKPHPNGLLCYFSTFKTAKGLPFVFDLEPDLKKDESLNPKSVILEIASRWTWNLTCNVVADAAFHSQNVLEEFQDDLHLTVSVNRHHKQWLFELLERYCPDDKWIAVSQRNHIWSVLRSGEATHFMATNAFSPISKLHPATAPVSHILSSNLMSLSKADLSNRATQLGLPSPKEKKDIADLLSRAASITDANLAQIEGELLRASQSSPCLHHSHYHDQFNGVDLIDRYWYQLQHKKAMISRWESKYLLSLLEVGVVNAFSLFREGSDCTFEVFALNLSFLLVSTK